MPFGPGTATVDSGSRKACSTRWVWKTSCTVCTEPGESGVDVAPRVHRAGEHVALELPDRVLGIVDRGARVGDRTERLVGDIDELGRFARGLPRVGDDDGEDVAEIRGAAPLGDEHGPVGVDDPDAQLTGDVGGGEHGLDTRQGACGRGVDAEHVGSGVVGEPEGAVQHAREP